MKLRFLLVAALGLDFTEVVQGFLELTGEPLAVHAESRRAATNVNNSFADSYATFDLGARYTTGLRSHAATVRFQVINVSDTRYYSSIADGNIVGSPGANTAYGGTPRTFQASIELDLGDVRSLPCRPQAAGPGRIRRGRHRHRSRGCGNPVKG